MREPTVQPVNSLEDPRIAAYRNLKDRELARWEGRFIAEGLLNVQRLLESDYPVESALVTETRVGEVAALVPAGVPVFAAPERLFSGIVGFGFHGGALACGRRRPGASLEQLARRWAEPLTIVILPKITSTENLGGLLRISSAFGAAAVVLGPECCDPFYRQAIRVSMGTVFKLPLVRSADLAADLARLRNEWDVPLAAAVLDRDAEPLHAAGRGPRLGLLFGNETTGLPGEIVALCDRRVTIPMRLGTDSLNVAVAAAVFLHHFTHGQARPPGRAQ
ncbi:MAG TPA: RNA methyltransferase [Phycisphaerae bacterium]|nr:RNA methyltransferase [Phycisphaerae bacterium]